MKHLNLFKPFLLAIAVLFAAIPLQAQGVSNNNDDEVNKVDQYAQRYRPGQVIVKFRENSPVNIKSENGMLKGTGVGAIDKVMTTLGVTEAQPLMPLTGDIKNRAPRKAKALSGREIIEPNLSKLYCLKFEETEERNVLQAVEMLKSLNEVEFAEPNYLAFIQSTEESATYQREPLYLGQWGLNAIKLPQLWAMDKVEETRPIIAILDTGVDITHPDLADNIWTNTNEADGASYTDDDANGYVDDVHGWDFVAGTPIIGNGMDRNGHGTHCAGIAAAVGNNGKGITGANPDALILPIKVMGDDGTGDIATICRGIDYATAAGAHVLSMSFGGGLSAAEYQALCKTMTSYAVLVGAAGNSGFDINAFNSIIPSPSFPGAFDVVIGVMASNALGLPAGFTNYDPDGPFFSRYNMDKAFSTDVTWNDEAMWNYDVMAPGVGIMSTYLNGSYKSLNGTSMATPMVAGAISRILQVKGFDYARDYGLIGDMAMAKDGGLTDLAVFNAYQAASYDETNRQVALALTALEIDDSEGGDGDGRFDAGETIKIWPTIRSLWGHAQNIKISIEPYDENTPTDAIEVLENNVDFGWSLNSRGSYKSQNPIRVHVNENAWDGMHLPYKIVITSDNLLARVEQEHVFEVEKIAELQSVINEDMKLYPNKHYVVKRSIAIPQGITLTIMPGTRIEFSEGCYLQSEGKLIANGKPDSLIVFTTHKSASSWGGIRSHSSNPSSGQAPLLNDNEYIYTNADTTLFTLAPTDITPIKFSRFITYRYFPKGWQANKKLYLSEYLTDFHKELRGYHNDIWMNGKQDLMTDPNFITPPVLQMLSEVAAYPTQSSEEYNVRGYFDVNPGSHSLFRISDHPCDTISYCKLENVSYMSAHPSIFLKDCVVENMKAYNTYIFYDNLCYGIDGTRNNFLNSNTSINAAYSEPYTLAHTNYVNFVNNNFANNYAQWLYSELRSSNLINSGNDRPSDNLPLMVAGRDNGITTDHADYPSWLGSSKESVVRQWVYDSMNPNVDCFTTVDLSNMPTRPYAEAHGIVWKVVVDGKDAQDEFDELPPLGVGRHEFKVYFNRPEMDQNSIPKITMGLREPYTQTAIAEDGAWSMDDGVAVYTAYLTITGKTNADGLNRICVTGAKDNEFFEVPIEKYRFNVLVQAAGSMATGFAAEAGLGKVNLTWNNENNNFDDAMGFNVYRFQLNENNDTINKVRVNETIIDLEDTEYTDFNVTAGETYYYYYKVLSTDLKEYDISNVVAATPLTSIKGDANGSMSVNVADVVTIVSYLSQQDPQPFIFDAADVNEDGVINILDIVGVINIIAHPSTASVSVAEASAVYTIVDGILYVDSPVALGGVQVTVDAAPGVEVQTLESLDEMERNWFQIDENTRMLLSYSMSGKSIPAGKTPLLDLGNASMLDIVLSDIHGNELMITSGDIPTIIDNVRVDSNTATGIYDLMGRKISSKASDLNRLPSGIYIVNGVKVVK